jgi:hypothetical protein
VKKLINLILAVMFMAAFTLGCAGYASKETKVKCPKCGSAFTVDEAIKNFGSQQPYGP